MASSLHFLEPSHSPAAQLCLTSINSSQASRGNNNFSRIGVCSIVQCTTKSCPLSAAGTVKDAFPVVNWWWSPPLSANHPAQPPCRHHSLILLQSSVRRPASGWGIKETTVQTGI